ncbi:MAG TPA: hypothetical protein VNO30_17285 [Kofleriaceae bacterium]|nr:hypothetical protein [Kofleriaceae bacterium]
MTRLAATFVLAAAAVAGAGTGAPALADGPDTVFDPLTMDRHTPESKLDVDFAFVKYDEPTATDLTAIGFAISGQYVTPTGLGGYLSLPLSYMSVEIPLIIDDSALALGNVELGGLYAQYFSRNAAIVLHGGVALPTASDDDAASFQPLASSPRYGDFVQRVTNSTWVRLGVSPMGRSGRLFWRADVGLDLALDEQENAPQYSPIFRINVGGGLDLGSAHLLAELVTSVVNDDDVQDESGTTLALGARFHSGNVSPGVGLILPVELNGLGFDPEFAIVVSLAARL